MNYPGPFCTEHIVYMAVSVFICVLSLFFAQRFTKTEKGRNIVLKTAGAILFICISVNRISVTAAQINESPELYSWVNLIPYTFCGFASLALSLSAMFLKDDNPAYHFLVWFGLAGGIASVIYPDFLYEQTFWDLRSFSGLVHHTVLIWICCYILITGKIKPRLSKYVFYPSGFAAMVALGFFELYVLHFPAAMNIDAPLLSSLPVLTSWYSLFAVSSVCVLVIYAAFEIKARKTVSADNPRG